MNNATISTTELAQIIVNKNPNIEGIELFSEIAVEALDFMQAEKIIFYIHTFVNNNKVDGIPIQSIDLDVLVSIRKNWLSVIKKASRNNEYKKIYYAGLSLNLTSVFISAYKSRGYECEF